MRKGLSRPGVWSPGKEHHRQGLWPFYPRDHLSYPFFSLALFFSLGNSCPSPSRFEEWSKNSAKDWRYLEHIDSNLTSLQSSWSFLCGEGPCPLWSKAKGRSCGSNKLELSLKGWTGLSFAFGGMSLPGFLQGISSLWRFSREWALSHFWFFSP